MGTKIAVSFEEDIIRVVYASENRGKLLVEKTLVLKDNEFDDFLRMESAGEFIVVGHFRRTASEVIAVPPAKKTHLLKIIEAEIRKRAPELKQFSFVYIPIIKKEGEKSKEVLFLAVDESELDVIIDRFARCGKRVRYVYSNMLLLSQFVAALESYHEKTVLCLFVTAESKNIFLLKNGSIRFMRTTPSFGATIEAVDTDNINMTITYCRQTFKTNPEQIVLLNILPKEDEPRLGTIIPASPFILPENIVAPADTIREFLIPITALSSEIDVKSLNLMPQKYGVINTQKIVYASLIGLFSLLAVIGGFFTVKNLAEIISLNQKLAIVRQELKGSQAIISEYMNYAGMLQQLQPAINLMNEANSMPDIQKIMAAYRFLPMKNVMIKTIQINNQKEFLRISFSGGVNAATFAERHRIFQELVESFRKTPLTTVLNHNMELKGGGFTVEVQSKS